MRGTVPYFKHVPIIQIRGTGTKIKETGTKKKGQARKNRDRHEKYNTNSLLITRKNKNK